MNIGLIICGINFELTNWLIITNDHSVRGSMFMNITEICLHHHHHHESDSKNDNSNNIHNHHSVRDSDDVYDNRSSKYKGIKIRVKYNDEILNNLKSNYYNDVDEAANDCIHLLMLEWYQQSYHYNLINYSNNYNEDDDDDNRIDSHRNHKRNKETYDDIGSYHKIDKYALYGAVIFPKVYYMNTKHFSGEFYYC